MRSSYVVLLIACSIAVASAQAPKPAAPAAPKPAAAAPSTPRAGASGGTMGKATGDLAQLMRGMLFPNANLIFDAQSNDPGAPPAKEKESGGGASSRFSNVYTGWQVVENASIVLAESADLLMKPDRVCSNGKPVPVQRADWKKYAEGLRAAGLASLAAAKTKNQDKVIEVTEQVTDACSHCHQVYRDKGPAGSPARCTP